MSRRVLDLPRNHALLRRHGGRGAYRPSLGLLLVLAGAALLWAGATLSLRFATALGIFCFAGMLGGSGLEMIVTRRAEFATQRWGPGPKEVFTGPAAQLYGAWFAAIALLLVALGVSALVFRGGMDTFWKALLARPRARGAALTAVGGLIAMRGIVRVLAGTAAVDYGVPARAGAGLARGAGALVTLVGGAVAAIGVWLVLMPDAVQHLATESIERIFK